MEADYYTYLKSIADEMSSQAARVRNLIGDSHWLSDGHHKEYLLRSVLERHCPASVIVSRGFVLDPGNTSVRSTEQDILIIDNRFEAPLFHQGGLAIVFPSSVVASIEVKTTLSKSTVCSSVHGLQSVRNVLTVAGVDCSTILCLSFFFNIAAEIEAQPSRIYDYLNGLLPTHPTSISENSMPVGPNIITTASDLFFKIRMVQNSREALGYTCDGLATAIALAHLLDHISYFLDKRENDFGSIIKHSTVRPIDPPSCLLGW